MAYEQRDNSGSLWPNTRKRVGKKDPNVTGTIFVDGVEYWIDGWTKEHATAGRWISLSVRKKSGKQADDGSAAVDEAADAKWAGEVRKGALPPPEGDDIPF